MAASTSQSAHTRKAASSASIVLAFAAVYFFWGSTYTAIRIGAADMPALLFAGTRFLIAGAILLAWCWFRKLRIFWPRKEMMIFCAVGLLLLGGGNVGLVYAEKTMQSGLSSLVLAVIPLIVALIEMLLPGGEPLPARGWLGMALGFAGLVALVWPSIQAGVTGDRALLLALAALLGGAVCWAVGSVLSRRARLQANSFADDLRRNRQCGPGIGSGRMATVPSHSGWSRLARLSRYGWITHWLYRVYLSARARTRQQGGIALLYQPFSSRHSRDSRTG